MNRRKNKEKVKEEDRKGEAFRGEGGEFDREFFQKIRVRAADMAPALHRRAFRCAWEVFDTKPKLENNQVQSKTGAVRRFWKKVDSNVTEMGRPDRSTAVRQKIEELRRLSSPTRPICFRCSDIGHIASQCCNAVLCFACNLLGHRSLQCQSITELSFKTSIDPTPKPQLNPPITPTPPTHPKTPIISAGSKKGQKSIPVYFEELVMDSIKKLEMELAEIKQELALMKRRRSEMEIVMAGINAQEEKRWKDENESQKKPLVPKDSVNCSSSSSGSQYGTGISQPGNSINKGKDPMCSKILVPVVTDPKCSMWLDTNVSDTNSVAGMLQKIPSGNKKIHRTTSVCAFEKVLQAIEDERPLESQELTPPPLQMADKVASKGRSIGGSLRPRRSIRLRVHGRFVSVKVGC